MVFKWWFCWRGVYVVVLTGRGLPAPLQCSHPCSRCIGRLCFSSGGSCSFFCSLPNQRWCFSKRKKNLQRKEKAMRYWGMADNKISVCYNYSLMIHSILFLPKKPKVMTSDMRGRHLYNLFYLILLESGVILNMHDVQNILIICCTMLITTIIKVKSTINTWSSALMIWSIALPKKIRNLAAADLHSDSSWHTSHTSVVYSKFPTNFFVPRWIVCDSFDSVILMKEDEGDKKVKMQCSDR